MRLMIAAIASAFVLSACGASETAEQPVSDTGSATSVDHAADLKFAAQTLDGKAFSGEQLADKPAVLWFWAPWCPTCRAQAPNVSALGVKYRGHVNVVGVSGLASKEEIEAVAPTIGNVLHLVDVDGNVWRHFGVEAQSTYTLIDRDGRIVSEGYLDDAELNRRVAAMAARGA